MNINREVNKMDACRKIYFITPLETAACFAGILAAAAAMLALVIVC
jgi:hypothetical protein